ncbi:MAG: NifB/NifX family molybdenum-iron cluster-binding protein [Chloroflexota bacterium]|nr:NifB/NifX family molybdenum-iron cluster-binding protein [Chloroflexota bacterium]
MKIAFITDDGKTISRHFGRAGHYLIVEIEDGEEVSREMRDKLGHRNFHNANDHHAHDEQGQSGTSAESHGKHMSMAETISDCKALVCGGMGMGAYQSMERLNITPIVTQETDINAALEAYLKGDLEDHTEMLH